MVRRWAIGQGDVPEDPAVAPRDPAPRLGMPNDRAPGGGVVPGFTNGLPWRTKRSGGLVGSTECAAILLICE